MENLAEIPSAGALLHQLRICSAHVSTSPTVPLEEIADDLRAVIRRVPGLEDAGRVTPRGTGYVIETSSDLPLYRHRFTVAHELGHIMLQRAGVPFSHQVDHPVAESVCNSFASYLLLPVQWLKARSDLHLVSLKTLDGVARDAGVSQSAAFVALARTAKWHAALLHFHWDEPDARWIPLSVKTRVRPTVRVEPTWATSDALGGPEGRTSSTVRNLPLAFDGREASVPCDVRFSYRSASVMVDLRPLARWFARP